MNRKRAIWLGSAGILPAATGMLPAASASTCPKLAGSRAFSVWKLSGNMPDRAGNMPALPRSIDP